MNALPTIRTTLIICSFLLLLLAPISPQHVQVSYAFGTSVSVNGGSGSSADIKTSVESTISAAAETVQAGIQETFFIKEFTLDGIAFGIAKTLLKGVTNSLLNWINSGFQGSPAFVTDLDGFLLDVADQAAGEFIYGTELGVLCSPFALDIRLALDIEYQQSQFYEPVCTISGIVDNIENFSAGTFSAGGWPGWFELTQNPNNNPTGAYLAASAELSARLINAEGRSLEILSANDFFLNIEVCDEVHSSTGKKTECQTSTPGHVISTQLNEALGLGQDALIEADEINEIIGALFAQLAQQAITGTYGLLGLGASQYTDYDYPGGDGSTGYLDALDQEIINEDLIDAELEDIQEALAIEVRYQELQLEIVERVQQAAIDFDQIRNQYIFVDQVTGNQFIRCFDLDFPTEFVDRAVEANDEFAISQTLIDGLQELIEEAEDAITPEDQQAVADKYVGLQEAGLVRSDIDIVRLESDLEFGIGLDIDTFFADEVQPEVNRCNT